MKALVASAVTGLLALHLVGDATSIARAGGPRIKVRKAFPASGAADVTTDPLVLEFSTAPDPATLNAVTLHLRGPTSGVPGTATMEGDRKGRRMVFRPAAPLLPGAAYEFIVTTGVRSLGGSELDEEFRLSFRTSPGKPPSIPEPLPDRVRLKRVPRLGPPPRVIWTFPAIGLGNVYTDDVTLRFDRPLSAGTVTAESFRLQQGPRALEGHTEEIPGSGSREFRFIPAEPLYRDTSYEVVVTRAVRSERGRPMRTEFHGGFSTSPLKEGVRPLEPADFQPGPLLLRGRAFHTADRLDDGRVVVVGGQDLDGTPTDTAEVLYSPDGTFAPVPALEDARTFHASAVLRDGRLLVTGGYSETRATLPTCEAYDPDTGTWSPVALLATGRASHTATVLSSGRVLVAGGFTRVDGVLQYANQTEIFDPFTNQWSAGPALQTSRGGHTATVLKDGKVLLAGGARFGEASAEVFDPITMTTARTAGNPGFDRTFHAAALTKSGTVLIAGGGPPYAEQYVPLANGFSLSGPVPVIGLPVTESPLFLSLTPISEGRVVLMGGLSVGGGPGGADLVLSQVLVWDAGSSGGTGAFYRMPFELDFPRAGHTVTPLADGSYLIAGGLGTGVYNLRATTFMRP